MSARADEIKKEVTLYAHIMDDLGLVNTAEGNLSIMDRETGELFITPSGTRKRFVTEETVAVLDADGNQIDGAGKRSSEYLLHVAALKARPDCNACAHIHAPYLTAYAYCNKPIEIKCSTTFSLLCEEVPCLPYGEPGTVHIADGLEEAMKEHDLVLLGNHGVVAVGKTLEDACTIIEATEEVMKIYHLAQSIGEISDISDEQLESLWENHPASKRNKYGRK